MSATATQTAPTQATHVSSPKRLPAQVDGGAYRFSLEQYHAMVAAHILGENDRAELIDGYLVERMSVNPPHATAVYLCGEFLRQRVERLKTMVFTERPIDLPPATSPEPDLALVKYRADVYAGRHPIVEDLLLVIEVADDSLERDRLIKRPRYAEAGIPEYWILNLRERQLECYTQPTPGTPELGVEAAYAKTEVVRDGETSAHPTLGVIVPADLLPTTDKLPA